jgi:hypothetical protein
LNTARLRKRVRRRFLSRKQLRRGEIWCESDGAGQERRLIRRKENPRRYPLDTEASIG